MTIADPKLTEVADGVFAYEQPDGAWGLSNSGLISGSADQLLVDTLFDLRSTSTMLSSLQRVTRFEPKTSLVLNTHANGDHCYGNSLLTSGRIISSHKTQREMRDMPAAKLRKLMTLASLLASAHALRRPIRSFAAALGLRGLADFLDAAPYVAQIFGAFDFRAIPAAEPTETFSGELHLTLGDRQVDLLELGPAHTEGDVIAFDIRTRTLFAGDLLFVGCHPLAWSGTPSGCIKALERLLALDPEVVVPGHGPLTNREGILDHIAYFTELREACRPLFHDGIKAERAAGELMTRGFGARAIPERLYVNVEACYREFGASHSRLSPITAMGAMSRLAGLTSR